MHSPFVFDFILHVLNNKRGYVPPAGIEALRNRLLRDERRLHVEDLGAGSRTDAATNRTVAQLARSALKPKKYAQAMFRLASHYRSETVVELGTSLGVTTAYVALAVPSSSVFTVEGSEAIAAVAQQGFNSLGLQNVKPLVGNFDSVLPRLLPQLAAVDLAYVDGNHRYGPTLDYFRQLLPKMRAGSVMVFDDIHWSEGMEKAWAEIKSHPSVLCTVDVFFLGFVFFRTEFKAEQHFTVRF